MDSKKKIDNPNPRLGANCFSALFFGWTLPMFKLGYRRELQEEDMYNIHPDFNSHNLGDDLESNWKRENDEENPKGKRCSLFMTIAKMHSLALIARIFMNIVTDVAQIGQVYWVAYIIKFFEKGEGITLNDAYMSAGGISILAIILAPYRRAVYYASHSLGLKIKASLSSMIYRKALRLNKVAFSKTTVGEMVSLLSNDMTFFDYCVPYIMVTCTAPILTIIATYLLWLTIGYAAFAAVAVLLIQIPFNLWIADFFSTFRTKTAKTAEERIRLMNEIICGIRVIKMYTWEKPFSLLVESIRRDEVNVIRKTSYLYALCALITSWSSALATCVAVIVMVVREEEITASKVFVAFSYIETLKFTLIFGLLRGLIVVSLVRVSIRRIQNFLEQNEFVSKVARLPPSAENPQVAMRNATAKWDQAQKTNTLANVTFEVKRGDLLIVIGQVGSGKSSLLQAILGELLFSSGSVEVHGNISYASQEAWVFAGPVQQNILFGLPFDEERYKSVVRACALEKDFEQLPHGDYTLVGERGVALSGGQKARVNLARALYRQADVYLLDDPLSAVDAHVGKKLFQNAIKDYLKNSACVLVTHQLQFLKQATTILVLGNGKVEACGTYETLSNQGLDFTRYLAEEEKQNGAAVETPEAIVDATKIRERCVKPSPEPKEKPVEEAESRTEGRVSSQIYFQYLKAGSNMCTFPLFVILLVLAQVCWTGMNGWLMYWVDLEHLRSVVSKSDSGDSDNWRLKKFTKYICLYIYLGIIGTGIVLLLFRSLIFMFICMKSSINIHSTMFYKVIRASTRFFDVNPSGRILNRFSKDLGAVDEVLPEKLLEAINSIVMLLATLIVLALINQWMLIPTVLLGALCVALRYFCIPTIGALKRLEGVTRSPVFSHLNATLQGLSTIRALEAQGSLREEFEYHLDQNSSTFDMFNSTNEGFGMILGLACAIYLTCTSFVFLLIDTGASGGNVGLAISLALGMSQLTDWCIRMTTDVANMMTSVERLLEYTNIEQESAFISDPDKQPREYWPRRGEVKFDHVTLTYTGCESPVLKDVSFTVKPGEKVGVVGRTGAGKSSLIVALFRMSEPTGVITIDDMDIQSLGLTDLRRKISIIPQDPVLFYGTLRKNLDPFSEYTDYKIWRALEEVELQQMVSKMAKGLNAPVSEGGGNFSVGHRQLVCLARAILKENKVLILDEATANMDHMTDAVIQKTIRRKFKDCTIITVAHRLNTIMDSDKVLVMDAGRVMEFDHPYNLLQNEGGYFFKLLQQTGPSTAEYLHKIAHQSFLMKNNMENETVSNSTADE